MHRTASNRLHRGPRGVCLVCSIGAHSVTSSRDGILCADYTAAHLLEFPPRVFSICNVTGDFFLDGTTPTFSNVSVVSLSHRRERGLCNAAVHSSVCVEYMTTIRHSTVLYVVLHGPQGRSGHTGKHDVERRVVRRAPSVLARRQITSPVTTSSASLCHPSRPLRRFLQGSDNGLTLCRADRNLCWYHRHLRSFHLRAR